VKAITFLVSEYLPFHLQFKNANINVYRGLMLLGLSSYDGGFWFSTLG